MRRAVAVTRLTALNATRIAANPLLYVGLGATALFARHALGLFPYTTALDVQNSMETAGIFVAAVMFVVTTFPAVREARYSRVFVAPVSRTERLWSLLAAAALVTLVSQAGVAAACHWFADGPTHGTVSPYARAAPFVLALCGPTASVAVAAWTRSYAQLIIPVVLVPAYYLYMGTALSSIGPQVVHRVENLALITLDPFETRSPQITVLSLLYLVYLLLVFGALVSVALAARPRRGPARGAAIGAAAVFLSGAVAAPAYANTAYGWEHRFPDDALYGGEDTECQVREGITYCPLPGFEPWVDSWHEALSAPVEVLPERARDGLPVVWQDGGGFTRATDFPQERGIRVFVFGGPEDAFLRLDLRNQVSQSAFGLRAEFEGPCWATGQARLPLMYWLTTVGAETVTGGDDPVRQTGYHLASFGPSATDLEVARALEETPSARVAKILAEHWEVLTAPETPTTDLAELIGLPLTTDANRVATATDWHERYPRYAFDPEYDLPMESAPTCA
ncbi:hypothetical protein KIK06_11345 [Nocardiopsis sp. EMB25]|uniref:hypothetical protein n=1 Tax=Nocardiopsis sp. EMB25 TaxID=2835867 RepID=UPI002284F721|nr:hypothetical protein [Nocardiopsis sp. EMB25]MCY9784486.1 hypothetical protein [Nocardiopsis sp. EMB25]